MFSVDTHHRLHVLQGDRLLQHHLVERPDEESCEEHKDVRIYKHCCPLHHLSVTYKDAEALTIEQFSMIHRHAGHTADELEVGEVVFVTQTRVRVNLQRVVVPGRQTQQSSLSISASCCLKATGMLLYHFQVWVLTETWQKALPLCKQKLICTTGHHM